MATSAFSEQKTLFCRMIDMGIDPQLCMKFMALWMWLEISYQGFDQLVTRISYQSDDFVISVLEEAQVILSSLDLCSSEISNYSSTSLGMRNTLRLAQRFMSINSIIGDTAKLYEGIVNVYNEMCCVVLRDVLRERRINISLFEEKRENYVHSSLNPFAKSWNFATERAPLEERCLFLTFSNGYPLTENQIFRKYGQCVERVYVHWPTGMRMKKNVWENESKRGCEYLPALFGKVIFNTSSIPAIILCGRSKVKFFVDRKPLWCKKYDPNRNFNYLVSN